jgi:tetratricopeptide (TPR) repeat protein
VPRDSKRVPLLDELYRKFLTDDDTAAFITAASKRYCVATLERLVDRGSRISRRGAVLALGYLGDYESNAVVGRALIDRDRMVRLLAENAIRSLWCRIGTENQRQVLAALIRLNNSQQYTDSIRRATRLIDQAPWIAEAWNQRAIAYFGLSRYSEAIRDCHQTLDINPYHFGAASGMGFCYMHQNDPVSALECFRRALRLNPDLDNVRAQVVRIQRKLKERGK